MVSRVIVAIACLLCGGCVKTVEEMGYGERLALAQQAQQRCYGMTDGSEAEMNRCMRVEGEVEGYKRQQQRDFGRRLGMGLALASQSYANSIRQNSYTYTPTYTPSRTTYCNTLGTSVVCNSY